MKQNISLHDKAWFGTGGPAEWLSEPSTIADCQEAIVFARKHCLPVTILGLGANLLISDRGVPGVTIRPQLNKISHNTGTGHLCAQAGVDLHDLFTYALDNRLLGLEEFAGIPGTVGGAMYINIHYFKHLLSDFVISAQVIDLASGSIETVDREWFCFGYDQSTLMQQKHLLLNATFQLTPCSELEAAFARGRLTEIIRHRKQRYPYERTCGSFFRNFLPDELRNDTPLPYVAYYLDQIGVKGHLRVGGARVSHKHANMIVTDNTATSNDVIQLARCMQESVYNRFGLMPQPECQLIGFDTYPLHEKHHE